MSNEHLFSATHVFAVGFWAVGVTGVLVNMILDPKADFGDVGLLSAGVGLMLNIRAFILHHHCEMLEAYRATEERERQAFEIGRDVERVTTIHR